VTLILEDVSPDLNYFTYFTEIEEAFIRRRGKHLWLSPVDWALMENWKERGVPLHIALRGIEKSFDSFESKPRHRSVKSLAYCQEEVEAQYAEWLESQVGSTEGEVGQPVKDENGADDKLPFPRTVILEHLTQASESLSRIAQQLNEPQDGALCECFTRAALLLRDLSKDLETSARPEAEKLEQSLTHLERQIDAVLAEHASKERIQEAEAFADEQLKGYKGKMEKAVYLQTRERVMQKRLREDYAVPRLSLFYL
jgi:hypothetical protein